MKKQFTVVTPLTAFGTEPKHIGDLEISGTATCDHPANADSYQYDIEDIVLLKNGGRFPFHEYITSLFDGEVDGCKLVKYACDAHMPYLWQTTDLDITTDRKQLETAA